MKINSILMKPCKLAYRAFNGPNIIGYIYIKIIIARKTRNKFIMHL